MINFYDLKKYDELWLVERAIDSTYLISKLTYIGTMYEPASLYMRLLYKVTNKSELIKFIKKTQIEPGKAVKSTVFYSKETFDRKKAYFFTDKKDAEIFIKILADYQQYADELNYWMNNELKGG